VISVRFFAILFLFCTPLFAEACEVAFKGLTREREARLLQEFQFDPARSSQIGVRSIYKMLTPEGSYYVRPHFSISHNVFREQFFSSIINDAPGVRVTQIRVLDEAQSKRILAWLGFEGGIKQLSVAVEFPGPYGMQVFERDEYGVF